MKRVNKFKQVLFCLLLIPNCVSFAQGDVSGVYENIKDPKESIIMYSTDSKHYVALKNNYYYDSERELIESQRTIQGFVKQGNEMNFTYGPFASYGREGYFFRKGSDFYYYDELLSAYEADVSTNPDDTLNYIYKKVKELDPNWNLLPKERLGELGVINPNLLYEIVEIQQVKMVNGTNCKNCNYIIEGIRNDNTGNGQYVFSKEAFLSFEISKQLAQNPEDLKGKVVQLFFKWNQGQLPGYLQEENNNPLNNPNSCPYEMRLVDKPLNKSSLFNYPIPKN
jgi:hypothetical protein